MRTFNLAASLLLASGSALATAAPPNPEQILERSDEVRNPQADFELSVTVTNHRPDAKDAVGRYDVKLKGRERSLIETFWPEIDKGKSLLMRGHEMFVFLPNVSQPVRISLQQRLFGAVSVGDVARANFSGDYAPKLAGEEKDAWILELNAKYPDLAYSRIRLWVSKDGDRPLKADFYTATGIKLKSCAYEAYRPLAGRERPSKIVVSDAMVKDQISTIEVDQMKTTDLQEKIFTKDYLKRLKY